MILGDRPVEWLLVQGFEKLVAAYVPVKSALFFALMRHVCLVMVATGIIENRRGSNRRWMKVQGRLPQQRGLWRLSDYRRPKGHADTRAVATLIFPLMSREAALRNSATWHSRWCISTPPAVPLLAVLTLAETEWRPHQCKVGV